MRRPTSSTITGLLLAAVILPAAAFADDVDGWRARRGANEPTPTRIPLSSFPNGADDEIQPITWRPERHPPVSTWSRIRRAQPDPSFPGTEFPSLQTAGYVANAPHAGIVPAAHGEAVAGDCPPGGIAAEPMAEPMTDVGYSWQLLPPGLLYKSYMAGTKESRLGTATLHKTGGDTFQDSTLGGRIAIIRFGTPTAIRPEGWELDFEGAAFLRQNLSENLDVDAVDFRYGIPLTWRRGPLAIKFGFYHLSSHVGDEFLLRNPGFRRINYLRDSLLLGASYDVTPDWRVYGEAGYAFHTDGGAEPWEFQFGAEYSPVIRNGIHGSPFFAINAHLREEVDFGGGVNVMAGWQWRSRYSDRVFRIGLQYYNGKSMQYSFFNRSEQLIGGGVWFDF